MSLRDSFVLDQDAQDNGIWMSVTEGGRTLAEFKVRRARPSNPKIAAAYREIGAELRPDLDWGDLSDEDARELQTRVYARAVVADWRGVKEYDLDPAGDKEKDAPYSSEACEQLLRQMPELLDTIVEHASRREHFSAARRKQVAGNS